MNSHRPRTIDCINTINNFVGVVLAPWANLGVCLVALSVMTSLSGCGGGDGASPYAINVYVAGLTGSGLQVSLNGGGPISISENSQTTIAHLENGTAYTVVINAQPVNPPQTCTATNPSGKISGNNVDVTINCVALLPGTSPTSTMVTIDSTVPASVDGLISQVISPLSGGAIGSLLAISIAGSNGQSIALCLDANNNIVLASIVTSSQTTLSSDSTALAMVRLAIGDVSKADAASSIDTAIRASAGYADLVAAVQSSLGRETTPATDAAVLSDIAAVIDSLGSAIPATASSAKIKSIEQPTVTGPPFTVIEDTLVGGLLPVEITSSSVNFVTLTNPMPIPWRVSSVGPSPSSGGTGPPISTDLALPGGTLLTAGSVQVGANNAGFSLTVQQTDDTHRQIRTDLVIGAIQTGLDFAGISLTDSCTGSALVTSLSNDLDTYRSPGESWQAFASKLAAFDVTPLISACTTSKTIKSIVSATINLLDGIAELKLIAHAGALASEATYAYTYWTTSPTLGVCESANWTVTNCADSYVFTPSSILMAPGAIYAPNLSALDAMKVPTLVPAGLKYVPSDPNLVGIDQTSGQITAATGFGTVITGGGMPDAITVTDQDTAATGSLAVMVIYPQITVFGNPYPQSNPTSTSIPVGGSVLLQLTDPNGNSVVLPSGIAWTSSNSATLMQVGTQSAGGSTLWNSPDGATPDTVTISAIAPDGLPYGTAIISVTKGQTYIYSGLPLVGDGLDPVGTGPVTASVTLAQPVATSFTGTIYGLNSPNLQPNANYISQATISPGTLQLSSFDLQSSFITFQGGVIVAWLISDSPDPPAAPAAACPPSKYPNSEIIIGTMNYSSSGTSYIGDYHYGFCDAFLTAEGPGSYVFYGANGVPGTWAPASP